MEDILIEKAFNFISPLENNKKLSDYNSITNTFRAYPDGKSRYSIGFGTLANSPYEEISENEAQRRSKAYIKNQIADYSNEAWFNSLNENQKIAVLSYAYQYGQTGFRNSLFADLISKGSTRADFDAWAELAPYSYRRQQEVAKFFEGSSENWAIIMGILLLTLGLRTILKK